MEQPNVYIVHQHKVDREGSKQIDAIESGPTACWIS